MVVVCAEILRWLKGALLEFEACRVRGNLNEKPPTLISMLQAAGLGVGGEKEAPVPKPGNGKRRDNMSASEFAQSVLQASRDGAELFKARRSPPDC